MLKNLYIFLLLFPASYSYQQTKIVEPTESIETSFTKTIQKNYIKALSYYMKVYSKIYEKKDELVSVNSILKTKYNYGRRRSAIRERDLGKTMKLESELLWSVFKRPEDMYTHTEEQPIVFKESYTPDKKQIEQVSAMNSEQEILCKSYKTEIESIDKELYQLLLEGYAATKMLLTILNQMSW